MSLFKKTLISLFYSFALISLLSCEGMPGADARKDPPNPDERVKKNLEEGRGFRLDNLIKGENKGGDFMFASANELWRASLDTIDFMPLTSVNYSGGIIITDWFSAEKKDADSKRELKITVKFLTNEIRADAVDVMIFEKICKNENCNTNKIQSKLEKEIKLAILKKATLMEKEGFEKYYQQGGKNKAKVLDNKK